MYATGAGHSSLLVVCNRVYVKRKDTYYPGVVQAKDSESCDYTVLFADGSTATVHESNLVWLGFWGLPAFSWPQHPVIQTCNAKDAVYFEGDFTRRFPSEHEHKPKEPKSFKILDVEETGSELPGGGKQRRSRDTEVTEDPEQRDSTLARSKVQSLDDQDKSQHKSPARSSVLRLNHDLLPLEMNTVDECSTLGPHSKSDYNSSVLSEQLVMDEESLQNSRSRSPSVDEEEVRSCNNYMALDIEHTKSRDTHEDLEEDKEPTVLNDLPSMIKVEDHQAIMQTNTNSSIRNHGIPLVFTQSTGIDALQSAYHRDKPSQQVPHRPSHRTKESFDKRFAYSTKTSEVMKEKQGKTKTKRGATKKCRRVFGVSNKEAWCEHCKWKKACTRFRDVNTQDHL